MRLSRLLVGRVMIAFDIELTLCEDSGSGSRIEVAGLPYRATGTMDLPLDE